MLELIAVMSKNNESSLRERLIRAADPAFEVVQIRQAGMGSCAVRTPQLYDESAYQKALSVQAELLEAKKQSPEKALDTFLDKNNLPFAQALDLAIIDARFPESAGQVGILRDDAGMQRRLLGAFRHPNVGYQGGFLSREDSPARINTRPHEKDGDIYELIRQRNILRHEVGRFTVALEKITWLLMSEGLLADVLSLSGADNSQKPQSKGLSWLDIAQAAYFHEMMDDNNFPLNDPKKLVQGVASVYYVSSSETKSLKKF